MCEGTEKRNHSKHIVVIHSIFGKMTIDTFALSFLTFYSYSAQATVMASGMTLTARMISVTPAPAMASI